jgi:hypothetical protein
MTTFKIYTTNKNVYRFRLYFRTRFLPAILSGYDCIDEESCMIEMKMMQQQMSNLKNLSFTSHKKGYRFTVFSPEGKPVANSRFFQTQHLMKRILFILQVRIDSASVQWTSGPLEFSHAA